ncbi:MAG: (2Fe-2S)-binding protein [Candidatus Binataceae bacterium]|nr:(2Fe-2S)-binding protein [Candidatus Binataceae bacterium]
MKIVKVTVDGRTLEAPEGTPLLQVMLDAGMDIPHYCYHPKLSIDGSCRFCQVRIEGIPKLQISCNTPVRDGMVVKSDDPEVHLVRRGVVELLLLNHPLDCPICDKAGECWLQNYAMRFGNREGHTIDPRRKRGKRLDIGDRMLLDQERCILCRRCVRFCNEVSKTGELHVFELGEHSKLDIYDDQRLDNDYSMNTADICPVGALETKDFHHKIRVWFLQETATVCPTCANGCNAMLSVYKNRIWRMTPRRNDEVNETWLCDWGRLNIGYPTDSGRLRVPIVDGAAATWNQALDRATQALTDFTQQHGAALGAVVSPHLTNEENFRFGELLKALQVKQVAMAVQRWKPDDLLIKAEKAANARGVRELKLVSGADDGLEQLLGAIESGAIKGLYLCGDDLLKVTPPDRLEGIFSKLELLIVQSLTNDPRYAHAKVIFPTTTFAEKEGTFTNHAGRVQRITKALDTPAGWIGDGELFTHLLNAVTASGETYSIANVWDRMSSDGAAFAAVQFDNIGPHGVPLAAAGK